MQSTVYRNPDAVSLITGGNLRIGLQEKYWNGIRNITKTTESL